MTMSRLRRREDGEHGAISIMAAAMLVVTLLATSLAVDVGRVAYVSRDQQGVTDRAAMDTVRRLDTSTAVTMAGLHAEAVQAVEESLGRNPGSSGTAQDRQAVGVVLGAVDSGGFVAYCGTQPSWVVPATALPACSDPTLAHGVADVTAIEVFTNSVVPFVFAIGAPTDADSGIVGRAVHKRARAGIGDPIGSVSAATTAVDLGDGMVTDLLGGLLGADTSLSLVGWNGLLQTQVTLRDIAVQLGVGTVSELLDTEVTVGQLVTAMATALQADSELAADVEATLVEMLGATLGVGLPAVRLGDLLDVDPGAAGSAMDAGISAGTLLTGFAQVANHAHAVSVDLAVAGLTSVRVTIIEPPQIAIGRPGKKDGAWRTEAVTAQVRVDVGLPLGDVAAGTSDGSEDDDLVLPEVQAFRDRIDAISSCSQAMSQAGTSGGTIRSDLEAAVTAARDRAAELGLLTGALVSLVDGTFSLLGGVLSGLGCLLTPSGTREAIKADLHDAVDDYETLLRSTSGPGASPTPTGDPVLSLRLAHGRNALASIRCTDPVQADTVVTGDFGRVVLTSTSELATDPDDPAGVDVQLLDVDLGVLGRVAVGLRADMALGQVPDPGEDLTFVGPFPAASQRVTASRTGLGAVTDGIGLWTDIQVLGLFDLGPVVDELVARAQGLLTPLLTVVGGEVLDPLLDTLGLDLGVIEAAVHSATCAGPPRLLPNP